MVAYELGKCLPKGQGPVPLDLIRVESSSSAVVPNGGESHRVLGYLPLP